MAADTKATKAVAPRMVMTWVPPYDITTSRQRLRGFYGTSGPRNAITHLGLQFWVPAADGGLARSSRYGTITDAIIQDFVAWGHANGIKVMLCVYTGESGWDWPLAKNAFKTNRGKFINALIAEMQARNLDGIDVDLEGLDTDNPGIHGDKGAYVTFIRDLSQRVHARNKQITLDTFHYIYNGPNQNWWASLFPLVDGITSMGYADLGRNAPTWQSYAAQKAKARQHSAKLLIGAPSDVSSWQGNNALTHAKWFNLPAAGRTGVSIWDARNLGSAWRSQAVWQELKQVRQD
jgi:hypothetical protein